MFAFFPLLLLVVIAYNIVALMGGAGMFAANMIDPETAEGSFSTFKLMNTAIAEIPMPSGNNWILVYGDLFVVAGLFLLFIEIVRSTSSGGEAITNHTLSIGVLVLCIIEFAVVPGFATSTFFFLTIMALVDVVAGFTISIKAARRDFGVTDGSPFAGG
ncbi:MAG: hypothetical protein AAGB03_00355 [Pseudomonadota bacterium]